MPGAAVAEAQVLTKFRNRAITGREDEPARPELKSNTEELARIDLVSEQVGGEVMDHSGFLTRLLSSF